MPHLSFNIKTKEAEIICSEFPLGFPLSLGPPLGPSTTVLFSFFDIIRAEFLLYHAAVENFKVPLSHSASKKDQKILINCGGNQSSTPSM